MTKALEEILLSEGLITKDRLAVAKESLKNLGGTLDQVLIEKGFLTEEQILKALAKRMNTIFVTLSKYKIDPAAVRLLNVSLARKHRAIPIFKIEDKVTVAISNPLNVSALDDIRDAIGHEINPVLALDADIEKAIKEFYRGTGLTEEGAVAKVEVIGFEDRSEESVSIEKIAKAASGEQIVTAVNNIIAQAAADRSSDIHFEPVRDALKIRFRIDGVLEDFSSLPKKMHMPTVSRIKIMGGMDVAEHRIPQDGRVRVRTQGREIDMRIATYPTVFGEAATVRLLGKEELLTLEDIGFCKSDLNVFIQLITKPHGILLVTGPTGSGKTTTLYASLMHVNSRDKHILSIEDPVENEIPGIDQQQINPKAGLTFASALRSMLRQDPDIIMVGEIRDKETADMAIRASMTGHFVFSTLHTNTAIGVIPRLLDLGVESYLLSSTLLGAISQRLVRKICPKCKEETDIPRELAVGLGVKSIKSFKGKGCKECRNTGYFGRPAIFEIIQTDDD
ncbi:MAG: type II/IV secretion system protein [Deltaproteobacteria bacterium]|nr:type II/IV secretion system protein [Deltaproteobacteria bacterium]